MYNISDHVNEHREGLQPDPATHLQTIRDNAANIVSQLNAAIAEVSKLTKRIHALTVHNEELFKSHQAICSAVQDYDNRLSEGGATCELRTNMVDLATGVKSLDTERLLEALRKISRWGLPPGKINNIHDQAWLIRQTAIEALEEYVL